MGGGLTTCCRINPFVSAVAVELVFPDRHSRFDAVDHFAAGGECFSTMAGRHSYPDCKFAWFQRADRMNCESVHLMLRADFRHDTGSLAFRKLTVGHILESHHIAAEMMIPHSSLECDNSAVRGRHEFTMELRGMNRLRRDQECCDGWQLCLCFRVEKLLRLCRERMKLQECMRSGSVFFSDCSLQFAILITQTVHNESPTVKARHSFEWIGVLRSGSLEESLLRKSRFHYCG